MTLTSWPNTWKNMPHWVPSLPEVVQTSHFFIASTLFLLCVLLGHTRSRRAFFVVVAFATFKEYFFDIWVEGDTWLSSTWDWVFYLLGACSTWLLIWGCNYGRSKSDAVV